MTTADAQAAPVPQGSFTVILGSVTNVPPPEGMTHRLSCWCLVEVYLGKEPNPIWWSSTSEESKHKACTSLLSLQGEHGLDNNEIDDEKNSFGYSQVSKMFSLTDAALIPTLFRSEVRVSLYQGHSRDPSMDTLIETKAISLLPVIFSSPFETRLTFSNQVTVVSGVAFDVAFVEAFNGCRSLSLHSLRIHHVPSEWRIVLKPDEDGATVCNEGDRNVATYSITITFPRGENTNSSSPQILWTTEGRLAYDNSSTFANPDEGWYVRFSCNGSLALFLSKVRRRHQNLCVCKSNYFFSSIAATHKNLYFFTRCA
jgi:hypothetical protein